LVTQLQIQNSRSQKRKHGRRVPQRSSTAIWWRRAIDSNRNAVRVRGSPLGAPKDAPLGGIPMHRRLSPAHRNHQRIRQDDVL